MLDPCAADLADAVARLCVLRTEDYTLVHTVYKRERNTLGQQTLNGTPDARAYPPPSSATSQTYIRYLTEEVKKREEERCTAEQRWCTSVRTWAHAFLKQLSVRQDDSSVQPGLSSTQLRENSHSYSAIAVFWNASGEEQDNGSSFQQVYAAIIRHAYELRREDLINTPFAQLQGSSYLYSTVPLRNKRERHFVSQHEDEGNSGNTGGVNSAQVPVLAGVARAHYLFFSTPSTDMSPFTTAPPSRILHDVHPLSEDDALTELSRIRISSSRHVWLVLFFLWCHTIVASRVASPTHPHNSSLGDAAAVDEIRKWLVENVLVGPASAFLRSQAQQLENLLTRVRRTYGE